MRTIRIDFTKANILPDGYILGRIGEHNATQLKITPPEEMTANDDITGYFVAFETGGLIIHSEKFENADEITPVLQAQLTMNKNIRVQLEGCNREDVVIMKSQLVTGLCFMPSVQGTETESENSLGPLLSSTFSGLQFNALDSENQLIEYTIYGKYPSSFTPAQIIVQTIHLVNTPSLPNNCFMNHSHLETITGLENLSEIPSNVCMNCYVLKNVKLNDHLTIIPNASFENCGVLTNLEIPETVTEIGNYAFYYCQFLEKVNLKSVTKVGISTFYYCVNVEFENVPEVFDTIGYSAFSYCYGLNFSKLKANSIGANAFCYCTGLTDIELDCPAASDGLFASCSELKTVKLKNDTPLMSQMFQNCSKLESITWETENILFPSSCLDGCSKLDMQFITTTGSIGPYAFRGTGLTSPVITTTQIGNYAFYNCSEMTSVTINEGCVGIGQYAFAYCGIKNISLPTSVSTISNYAFYYGALETFSSPNCSSYGSSTLAYNPDLTRAILGSVGHGITSINRLTFNNCLNENLTITVYKNNPSTALSNQPWGATYATIEYLQA